MIHNHRATTDFTIEFDPFAYTSGRWLNRDELERKSRHVKFDFSALCEKAVSLCPGATQIIEHEKKEGGFNKVFIFSMDTGARVVARIPTSIAGPPRLATNSEVATIMYSKILDWNDTSSNPIGAEYIIQEHVTGVQLHQKWPEMNSHHHMLCTKALSLAIKKMASLDFPAYGSLYFSDAPLESSKKIPLEDGFCIGPHCSSVFWNCNPGEIALYGGPGTDCGPCKFEDFSIYLVSGSDSKVVILGKTLTSYCRGLLQTGATRLPKHDAANSEQLSYQGSIQDHLSLLEISKKVMEKLMKDERAQNAAAPVLVHPDYHKRNIYVSEEDPTTITGLIDWKSASVEPAFLYADESPDFAALLEELEDDTFRQDDLKAPGQKEKEEKDLMICYQTYDVLMKGVVPKMRPARLLDPRLFRIFKYCHTSWRDSAAAMRQELIDLSTHWTQLGLESQGPCPYSPTPEELSRHASLNSNSDGWVPDEAWDAAKDAHRAAYDEWIQTARESEARGESMTVAKKEKLWPFDAR
ncbi:unnamed protein product [Penicillium salamii]|uniref:Altered inheritance of mitochondria protein 9, mitochondrial n=1 Tax=Penicillium salamii TaxID=1612424 RepID=A0A9W4NQN1_9EURO|nr:unnamed protein product [Penicillium salamii]